MGKTAPCFLALVSCWACVACGSRSGLLAGEAVGGVSGGGGFGAGGGGGGVARCKGNVTVAEGKAFVEDNGVSRQQLLGLGDRWAALVTLLVKGRYEAMLYFIDAEGSVQGDAINVTEDFSPSVDGAFMALDGDRLMVAWTGDEFDTGKEHLRMRPVALSGVVGPALELQPGVSVNVPRFFVSDQGLDFVLRKFASAIPQAARFSREGALLAGPDPLYPPYTGPGHHYGYLWLWPDRVLQNTGGPGGPQWLSLGRFEYGAPPPEPTQLFQAAGALHITSSIDEARPLVGVYDTDLGATLLTIRPDTATQRYQVPVAQGKRPKIARRGDCGYAVLVDRGKWKSTNPLSIHVDLHLLDESFDQDVGPIEMYDRIAGSCIEHHDVAVTEDGKVGVLWTEGCVGVRHVRFATVTVGS